MTAAAEGRAASANVFDVGINERLIVQQPVISGGVTLVVLYALLCARASAGAGRGSRPVGTES
ncbi:MAG TPA: hypothetical protein VII40_06780, partial [Xanthobacteraceae bacterium]